MRIHHQILLKLLAKRIADKRLLNLIERFLKAGIEDNLQLLCRPCHAQTPSFGRR